MYIASQRVVRYLTLCGTVVLISVDMLDFVKYKHYYRKRDGR